MHWGKKTNFNSPSTYLLKMKGQDFIRNYLCGQSNDLWDCLALSPTLRFACNLQRGPWVISGWAQVSAPRSSGNWSTPLERSHSLMKDILFCFWKAKKKKKKKKNGSKKRISGAKYLRGERSFGPICQPLLKCLLQIPSSEVPVYTESQALYWRLWFSESRVGSWESGGEGHLE